MKNEDIIKNFANTAYPANAVLDKKNSANTLRLKKDYGAELIKLYSYNLLIGYKTKDTVHVAYMPHTPLSHTSRVHVNMLTRCTEDNENAILVPLSVQDTNIPDTTTMVNRYEAGMEHLLKSYGLAVPVVAEQFQRLYRSYKKYCELYEVTPKNMDKYRIAYNNSKNTEYMASLSTTREDYYNHRQALIREGHALADSI